MDRRKSRNTSFDSFCPTPKRTRHRRRAQQRQQAQVIPAADNGSSSDSPGLNQATFPLLAGNPRENTPTPPQPEPQDIDMKSSNDSSQSESNISQDAIYLSDNNSDTTSTDSEDGTNGATFQEDYFQHDSDNSVDSEDSSESSDNDDYKQYEYENIDDPFHLGNRKNEPVGPGCLTFSETMCLLLSFAFKHSLSYVALTDLCITLNTIFNIKVFPHTKHRVKKVMNPNKRVMSYYMYCINCSFYLGRVPGSRQKLCQSCNKIVKFDLHAQNYFSVTNIPLVIQATLEKKGVREYIREEKASNDDNVFADLYDGSLHKNLVNSYGDIFTYNFFFDSASLFNSPKSSLTLLLLTLNCLPATIRLKNVIIGAVWYGKNAVDIDIFFQPFLEWAKMMQCEGVSYKTIAGLKVRKAFLPLCGIADAVARCKLQNMTAFNGKFGCPCCLHPNVVEGQRHNRFVLNDGDMPELRNVVDWKLHAEEAEITGNSVYGIFGQSILDDLPGFSVLLSILSELQHSGFGGLAKYLAMQAWFKNHHEAYYIGSPNKLRVIARLMDRIQLPTMTDTRNQNNIKYRAQWHASDWRWWLLYLSVPILLTVMPQIYVAHWGLFVKAVYHLYKNVVTIDDVREAQVLLLKFVWGIQLLYGPQFMTFNVHSMLHLPQSVLRGGPLWAYTAFAFESFIGKVKTFVTGTTGIVHQVAQRFTSLATLQLSIQSLVQNQEVLSLCEHFLSIRSPHIDHIAVPSVCGAGTPHETLENVVLHNKLIFKRNVYRTKISQQDAKNFDSCVLMKNDNFYLIHEIRLYTNSGKVTLQVEEINTHPMILEQCYNDNYAVNDVPFEHIFFAERSDNFFEIDAAEIKLKCIVLDFGPVQYVCLPANDKDVQ